MVSTGHIQNPAYSSNVKGADRSRWMKVGDEEQSASEGADTVQ
jgi:hypothetical protein